MIRTVKPPPKVNPHGAPGKQAAQYGRQEVDPYEYGPDPSYAPQPSYGEASEYRPEPSLSDFGIDDGFDFEAAVQEEMRKMEEELRSQVPARAEPPRRARSPPPQEDYTPPHDVFERPVPALGRDSPIKLSVAHEPSGSMFDSSIDNAGARASRDPASPGRRKGGAIASLYGEKDNRLNQKAAKAAEYANFLQQQIDEKKAAKDRERREALAAADAYQPPPQAAKKVHNSPPRQQPQWESAPEPQPARYGTPPRAREAHEPDYPAVRYEPARESAPSYRQYEADPDDDSMERLRRMQPAQQGGGYVPSGWGAADQYGNMQMENLDLPIGRAHEQHASPAVHPAPPMAQQRPQQRPQQQQQADFLSHASNRETRVSSDRLGHGSPSQMGGSDSDDKSRKKQKQNEYRLMLERQMEEQKRQKENMKSFWKGEDIPPDVSDAIRSQGVKHFAQRSSPEHGSPQAQQPGYQQPGYQQSGYDSQPQNGERRQHREDAGHQNEREYRARGGANVESERQDPNLSPKKVSAARNRLIQDIFGDSDLLSGNVRSPDKDNWKPSEKGGVSKRGLAANDYKAILDAQMREKTRLKEEEKEKLELEEKKERQRMLDYQREQDEAAEAEGRRRRAQQAAEEAENEAKVNAKAQEMLAKKHPQRDSHPPTPVESPDRPRSGEKRRDAYSSKFSPERHHLDVVLEDQDYPSAEHVSQQLKGPKTPPRFSRVSMGDGVSGKFKQPYGNFRKLEETIEVEERGATPGGALACNSSLVPIRDSVGGPSVIRSSGASNISYSSHWKDQARNSRYHQHHPNANFRPDIPKYDPSQDVEDDAIVVAWQEELNKRAREESFATSPRLLGQSNSPNSYGYRSNGPRSAEANRARGSHSAGGSAPDDPWGPMGLLSALGDRGQAPAQLEQQPTRSRLANNAAEQSLASESFLTFIENRRPMTQASKITVDSLSTEQSNAHRHSNGHHVPGSPLEGMIRQSKASEEQRRHSGAKKKKQQYQRPYYEDDDGSSSAAPSQYDSLNSLLRNSEERAGRNLFDVAAEVPQGYRRAPAARQPVGYREEYTEDGYRYSDDEELLVIG